MRKLLLASVAVAALAGCKEETDRHGLELLPDMFHTPALKSQGALTSPDGAIQHPGMLAPPDGVVNRDGAGYPLAVGDLAAARMLRNPVSPTPAVLRAGRADFEVFCGVCHGKDGNAGHAAMAPYFSGIPSLAGETYSSLTDGEVFHIISRGRGRMPAHLAQLPTGRRWGVVTYLRALQSAAVATAKGGAELEALRTAAGAEAFAPVRAPVPEYQPPRFVQPESKP